jgi:hypothetical protein
MDDWKGAARGVGYMEQRSFEFELFTSADVMWAICESSTAGFEKETLNEIGKGSIGRRAERVTRGTRYGIEARGWLAC